MRWQQVADQGSTTYPYRFMPVIRTGVDGLIQPKVRALLVQETETWCRENFPLPKDDWFHDRWLRQSSGFLFRDEQDAFAFKMRWG